MLWPMPFRTERSNSGARDVQHTGGLSRVATASILVTVLVAVQGCGSKTVPVPVPETPGLEAQASPQAIFDEWRDLVSNPAEHMDNPRCVVLAAMLAVQAPERLDDMIDMLIDPATGPQSKLMILTSLESVLQPSMVPRLMALTEPGVDGTIRSSVAMLLAGANDPNINQLLRKLSEDDDQRVRLAALNGLTIQGDESARAKLLEMYFESGTPAPFRERIALTFSMNPKDDAAGLLADALGVSSIQLSTRMTIAGALGIMGDTTALPALNACIEGDNPEDLKSVARDAVAAIQARASGESAGEAPAGTTTEGNASPQTQGERAG